MICLFAPFGSVPARIPERIPHITAMIKSSSVGLEAPMNKETNPLAIPATICQISAAPVAAISPLFYRPKPITLDGIVRFDQSLANVNKYNKELVDYIKNKVSKDKKYKEVNN